MDDWKKLWISDNRGCISPDKLLLPVGSGCIVKNGVALGDRQYAPQIGYVTPENFERLVTVSAHMDGFQIVKGIEYPSAIPRVDCVHPKGDSAMRMYCKGMFECYCIITDLKKALVSLKGNPIVTCCPVCTDMSKYHDTELYRKAYDLCSLYFLRYWYYGTIST